MSGKPEDAAKRDVAALAAELAEQIASLAAFSGSGLAPTKAPAPRAGSSPGVPSYAGPRAMLENAGRFVAPVLPAGAPLRPLKAALLRILRIVTRDQTTFNSALLEALRGALLDTEAGLRDLAAASREGLRRTEDFVREATARLDGAAADLSGFSTRLARESKAREAAGQDLLASQRRLDALEKDRDERAEALARERERDFLEREESRRRLDEAREALRTLRLEWSSLRGNLQAISREKPPPEAGGREEAPRLRADDPLRAGLYADFEEHFRGSEEEIRARQASDAARFRGAPGPVADLGCGRGEFLEALAAEGIAAIGCDANPVMAARAKEKKLAVDRADLFAWLADRADSSLGGVTAFQVVEHLPPASLFDLVELAIRKLAPSGRVLFETINPESVYAMRWFWMDLTHVRPVPAPSLAQLLTASGFRDVTVDFRSPVPEAEGLPPGLADDPRFAPLARLLFAPQDYAVTGVK
ncbi:MAG TPA: methyltransferase domain-containing protein [Thermoanaerobaculia bacterium]|nr:methyltransferase domain-containing protein [Thermoanaerobaculia bacterium]